MIDLYVLPKAGVGFGL